MGDFNLSYIEWFFEQNECKALSHEGRHAKELIDTLLLTNLSQINFVKNEYNRILDLVLTNMVNIKTKKTEGIVNEDAYHPALIFHIDPKEICFMKSKKNPKPNFFKANYERIMVNSVTLHGMNY